MNDVELVIKISKEKYDAIKSNLYNTFPAEMKEWGLEAIRSGAPLPKGHGVLKDADAMINKLCTHEASELFGSVTCAEILDFINDEKPIIGANKTERNDK